MTHFAEINSDSIVQRVIVAEQNFINSGAVGDSSNWIQTSPNSSFRKNYAGSGYTYDKAKDSFIPPQPYPSWVLVEATCQWESPVTYPSDGNIYSWNEAVTNWAELSS